jgi:multidrug efflux pump subunit AcrA (membrane-fusion protein)
VFVQTHENQFIGRNVQTGLQDEKNVEILGGLKPGELIAAKGGTALLGTALKATEGD